MRDSVDVFLNSTKADMEAHLKITGKLYIDSLSIQT